MVFHLVIIKTSIVKEWTVSAILENIATVYSTFHTSMCLRGYCNSNSVFNETRVNHIFAIDENYNVNQIGVKQVS